MLAIIWCRIICHPVSYPKIYKMIYKTIILPVILYGCEVWSLTLSNVHGLRVFKIMVLRKIFETRADNVRRDKRRLQNKELYDLYSSPKSIWATKSRRMTQAEHVACMGEERWILGFGGEA